VLALLTAVNLSVGMKKCRFGLFEVVFLGHVFNLDTLAADPVKVSDIISYPKPTSPKNIQRFPGTANYLPPEVLSIHG
jgi:hypothetical protein